MTVRFARAAAQVALVFAPFTMATAQTSTLDVTAQSPYSDYDNGLQSLGDHANLNVTGSTRTGFGASAQSCGNVDLWNAGYSNLAGVAFSCANGQVGEFYFQPAPGHQVFLSSLQLGSYRNGNRSYTVNVYGSSWGVPLYSASGSVGSLAITLNPNVSSSTGLYLQWGTDWNTGVNLITTTVSPEVVATPEPASMVLLATGLLGVAGFARRRRSAS